MPVVHVSLRRDAFEDLKRAKRKEARRSYSETAAFLIRIGLKVYGSKKSNTFAKLLGEDWEMNDAETSGTPVAGEDSETASGDLRGRASKTIGSGEAAPLVGDEALPEKEESPLRVSKLHQGGMLRRKSGRS